MLLNRAITFLSGGVSASFGYDALGRRISKTFGPNNTGFFYNGGAITQELNGSTVAANIWNGGTSYFQRTDASGIVVPLVDALGSVVGLADANGNVNSQYTYDPFGGTTISGATSASPNQYIGQENDLTGLYYLHARYYSPALHRFISEDPLGFGGGDVNLHAYSFSSPTNFRDPSGKTPVVACGVGGLFNATTNLIADKLTGRKLSWASAADYFVSGCAYGVAFEVTGINAAIDWLAGKAFTGLAQLGSWAADKLFTNEVEAAARETVNEVVEEEAQSVTDILQAHVDLAVQMFDESGFTKAQADAIASNPDLEAAYIGERIDFFAKQLVQGDPALEGLIQATPRGQFGPDFYNPATGEWWDITTPGQWATHVAKYGSGGTILIY
jgi:RHS repeat-associated protein